LTERSVVNSALISELAPLQNLFLTKQSE
jgi:hypothetical protein